MKLRNKKTGEIGNLVLNINPNRESYCVLSTENGGTLCGNAVIGDYDTLAELNEEWEDYEEPKTYWFINSCGAIESRTENEQLAVADMHKQFGNYFETEEEAEKAVEKLKAWKRLKDKGFRFTGWDTNEGIRGVDFEVPDSFFSEHNHSCISDETRNDLDLLFWSEE